MMISHSDKTIRLLSRDQLALVQPNEGFSIDTEVTPNYFLLMFYSPIFDACIYYELGLGANPDRVEARNVLHYFLSYGFNSNRFDLVVIEMFLQGFGVEAIWAATQDLIVSEMRPYEVAKKYRFELSTFNHIDYIEVCPLKSSLKGYGARLHAKHLTENPITIGVPITPEQVPMMRDYCFNDNRLTALIASNLKEEMKLRYDMSERYGVDLRSKSDAQIAEAVITHELKKVLGYVPKRPGFVAGTVYKYEPPAYVSLFTNPELIKAAHLLCRADYRLNEKGVIETPPEVEAFKPTVGRTTYTIGIGGLHSNESKQGFSAENGYVIKDRDVESFYPRIILNRQLYPKHLGSAFLTIYNTIVQDRLDAKKAKNKVIANSLKIVINGSFGKYGSKYSLLFSPDLLITVTVTGQLSLLLLIDILERNGITVISANTDGVVSYYHESKEADFQRVIKEWEAATNFKTEETEYLALYSLSVNDYIAVKPKKDGTREFKLKGCFSNPWKDPDGQIYRFHKTPDCQILPVAICNQIGYGVPVEKTIRECRDIREFVKVQKVNGGAIYDGLPTGSLIRGYYSTQAVGAITRQKSGYKVSDATGLLPLMELPDDLPTDINYPEYIDRANDLLWEMGYYVKPAQFTIL